MNAEGDRTPSRNRMIELLSAEADGWLDADRRRELLELLRRDPQARAAYAEQAILNSLLFHKSRYGDGRRIAGLPVVEEGTEGADALVAEATFPPIVVALPSPIPSPLFSLPSVGSWAFSYTAATVIVGLFLLGAWACKITHNNIIAVDSRRLTAAGKSAQDRPEMEFVGRITGMAGVKWSADPRFLPPIGFAHVPLGRKYIFDSGLMQITYDSGAKVILEGPCSYEVDSSVGGYLALGKLTARVETKGSGIRGQGSGKTNLRISKSPNPKSPDPRPPAPNPFVVTTPTSIVTDLGTEFGVEVEKSGVSRAVVFRGKVEMRLANGEKGQGRNSIVLRENESARVESGPTGDTGSAGGTLRLVHGDKVGSPPKFVRRLYEPPKQLDLLDIVAGGDGAGSRRECGIDPSSGRYETEFVSDFRGAYRRYRTVLWHRMIDGVFIPDGRAGAVQLDSAGHTFAEFPETTGAGWGPIWARAAKIREDMHGQRWIYYGDGTPHPQKQFMPEGRGLLSLHPNVGLTFDLKTIRNAYRGARPARFRAIAAFSNAVLSGPENVDGMADLWVFVDGRLKLKKVGINRQSGAVNVDVELGPDDRFLTISATDGGDGNASDWFILGDPVLQMASTESENSVNVNNERRSGQ